MDKELNTVVANELDDAELMDLGDASALTNGTAGESGESQAGSHDE